MILPGLYVGIHLIVTGAEETTWLNKTNLTEINSPYKF